MLPNELFIRHSIKKLVRGLHPDSHSPDCMEAPFCSFPQDKSCELFWYMSCICKSFITDNFFTNGSKFYKLRRNSSKGEKIVQIRFWLLLVQSLFCRENGKKFQLTFLAMKSFCFKMRSCQTFVTCGKF